MEKKEKEKKGGDFTNRIIDSVNCFSQEGMTVSVLFVSSTERNKNDGKKRSLKNVL